MKKSAMKIFQVCMIIAYDSFILELSKTLALVLALQCYFGDNVKYGLLSNHLLQRKRQCGSWKNLTVMRNF